MNIVDTICEDGIQGTCSISTGSGWYCPHMQSFFQILCDTILVLEQHVAAVSSQSTHPNWIKLDMNIVDAVFEDGLAFSPLGDKGKDVFGWFESFFAICDSYSTVDT